MATEMDRITALEQQVMQLVGLNQQLQGALGEQRQQLQAQVLQAAAAASARPIPQERNKPVVDTRLIGKPSSFTGREEDWTSWSLVLRAYAGAVSERLLYLMDEAEITPTMPANASLIGDGAEHTPTSDRELSMQLYYILTTLLTGKAADKTPLVTRGEGLSLWRTLIDQYESKLMTRRTGLFQ